MMVSWKKKARTQLYPVNRRNSKIAYQLFTSVSELEVRCRWRQLVDKLVNLAAESCVFISLEVGL